MSAQQNDLALNQLQSRAQAELLDAVDQLRKDGLQHEFDLPQLIVCGDQSSGKSSVLEAISGVRFPAKDVLCTHFASELVLRRASTFSFSVSIIPARYRKDNPAHERELVDFAKREDFTDIHHFPKVVEAATALLRKLEPKRNFFEDKLVASIRGPTMPPLTLVDLPGLIHASLNEQGPEDIETVRGLVESYMSQRGSIILAVLASDNNFANQVVLQLVKEVEHGLQRTLGIITKPDRVYGGSSSEISGIQYAQNRVVELGLGWHVLRNRDHTNMDVRAEERDSLEEQFFAGTNWSAVPQNNRGASSLRSRLSDILFQSIQQSLPSLVSDIKARVQTCERLAAKLDEPKIEANQQMRQLSAISYQMHRLIQAGVQGDYLHDETFFKAPGHIGTVRCMRARLRTYLEAFANHMHTKGRRFSIDNSANAATVRSLDFSLPCSEVDSSNDTERIISEDLLKSVNKHIKMNRGREMGGLLPPIVAGSIFSFQSAKWEGIAETYANGCLKIVKDFFQQTLLYTAPRHIAQAVTQRIAEPHLQDMEERLMQKLKELLKPYKSTHYAALNAYEPSSSEAGPNRMAWDVINTVLAQYEVALNAFVENFAWLAVENCIVDGLSSVFMPTSIPMMDAEEVAWLTREPENVVIERQENKERLKTLKGILGICNQHVDRCGEWYSFEPSDVMAHVHGLPLATEVSSLTPEVPTQSSTPTTTRAGKTSFLRPDPFNPTPPRTPRASPTSSLSKDRHPTMINRSPSASSSSEGEPPGLSLERDAGAVRSPSLFRTRQPAQAVSG